MFKFFEMHFPKPFIVLVLIEAVILICSFYVGQATGWVGFSLSWKFIMAGMPSALGYSALFLVIMFSLGVYNEIVATAFYHVVLRLGVSFILGFALLSAIFYAYPPLMIYRATMAGALVSSFLGILTAHYIFLHAIDLTPFKRRVLVLGAGLQAERIDQMERQDTSLGFVCMGFFKLADENPKIPPARLADPETPLSEFARNRNVSEIVIAADERRQQIPMEDLTECAFQGIDVIDYSTFWERETKRIDIDSLSQNWLQFVISFPGGRLHTLVKRLFDITVSILALVLLFPLIASTSIAIKLDSSGPIFYRQKRVGFRGKDFELLKFRSMGTNAEEDGVPRWASGQDDRVTGIGAFIRKVRLDEIPQIINVLKGEMSFVGPRPERPFFVDQLAKEIPFYRERFRVKPGITGWAQLNYPYGASIADARHKLEFDLYYIRHYGLVLDTIIVLQTLRVVLWPPKQTS